MRIISHIGGTSAPQIADLQILFIILTLCTYLMGHKIWGIIPLDQKCSMGDILSLYGHFLSDILSKQ